MPEVSTTLVGLEALEQLAPLFSAYREFYGQPADIDRAAEFLRARLTNEESFLFLAKVGSLPAGFAQLYPSFSSVSTAPILILNDLFVDERFRRRGIATALLEATASFARERGAVRLSLTTAETNRNAQALYEGFGYSVDREFWSYHLRIVP